MAGFDDSHSLRGKLLVAMPGMGDPRFEKSVVLLCEHSGKGAMGLIVNKPAPGLDMDDLLEQMSIPSSPRARPIQVHFGGPVETRRGFVLHSGEYRSKQATLQIGGDFAMTATIDVLEDMARGGGPRSGILALGYSGWAPGQLESEIRRNGWLTCDASAEIVFAPENGGKWSAALQSLGVDALSLSTVAGRA